MNRSVPEDRIKTIEAIGSFDIMVELPGREEYIQRNLVDSIGREIAERLMTFQKVSAIRSSNRIDYIASIDVIVPPGPPLPMKLSGTSWMGKPIEYLSRAELLEVIKRLSTDLQHHQSLPIDYKQLAKEKL